MSTLLVDLQSSASQASTSSWVDITGLSQSGVTVGSAGSVILMIATVVHAEGANTQDDQMAIRFAVDDTPEGPEQQFFHDTTNKTCGVSLGWCRTGLSGSHKFACQLIGIAGKEGNLATTRIRNFQVIEITDATILVNLSPNSADDADAGFTDIVGLTATPTVASGAVLLVLANMAHEMAASSEDAFGLRLTIGGSFEGPEMHCFKDAADEGCDTALMWVKDGISGSQAFALQWDETLGAASADQARIRSLQVIQITAAVNKLEAKVSQAADTLTGSYTDVVDLVTTVTVDSSESILIFAACIAQNIASDACAVYRFFEDDTGEGPEMHVFVDGAAADGCGHPIYWAVTGKSAGSHTFSLRGLNIFGTVTMDQGRNRSLAILELTGAQVVLDQEGFQFREDDDNEVDATDLGAQDANLTSRATGVNTRLRALIDATEDPDSETFALEYRRDGDPDTEFRNLPLT